MYKNNLRFVKKIMFGILVFSFIFSGITGLNPVYAATLTQYTVKAGDSLYWIAKTYNVSVDNIKAKNSIHSDMIYPGQVITIPGTNGGTNQYTVKPGDSLFYISRSYGVSISDLKAQNKLASDMIYPGQKLVIPNTGVKSLRTILAESGLLNSGAKLDILVDKSDHILYIRSQGRVLKSYHVELGDGGTGDKEVAGDHKTPEGTFYITEKSVLSPADQYLGTRWMRLSYPNIEDSKRGLQQGLIDKSTYSSIVSSINNGLTPPQRTALGGGIGIHGGSTPELGNDWTWGCVGLTNKDVEDFFNYVSVGTKVIIQK